MLIRINLLPYRLVARKRLQRSWGLGLLCALAVGYVLVLGLHVGIQPRIAQQQARNDLLRQELAALSQQAHAVDTLEGVIANLDTKQKALEELQASRSTALQLLNVLGRVVLDGVVLDEVKQSGPYVEIRGLAESSQNVYAMLQRLSDADDRITQPSLQEMSVLDPAMSAQDTSASVRFMLSFAVVAKH